MEPHSSIMEHIYLYAVRGTQKRHGTPHEQLRACVWCVFRILGVVVGIIHCFYIESELDPRRLRPHPTHNPPINPTLNCAYPGSCAAPVHPPPPPPRPTTGPKYPGCCCCCCRHPIPRLLLRRTAPCCRCCPCLGVNGRKGPSIQSDMSPRHVINTTLLLTCYDC